jgi:hypothetical protein
MAKASDVILALAIVAGLGLLIYAGEKIAAWGAGVAKGISNWATGVSKGITTWETNVSKSYYNAVTMGQTPQQIQQSGVGPWSLKTYWPNMNFLMWDIPEKEFNAIGNWWAGVEKRFEKSLTTWW